MKNHFITALLSISTFCLLGQWDPDAGLLSPLSEGATITATSSAQDNPPTLAIDGINTVNTGWVSGWTFPNGFVGRPDQNAFLNGTDLGTVTTSSSNDVSVATDGNFGTSIEINAPDGERYFQFNFDVPTLVSNVSLNAAIGSGSIAITAILENDSEVNIANYSSAENYSFKRYAQEHTVKAIKVSAPANFSILDVSAIAGQPEQYLTLDLGAIHTVGMIDLSLSSSDESASYVFLDLSEDNSNWVTVKEVDPAVFPTLGHTVYPPVEARYVRVRIGDVNGDYKTNSVREIVVYEHGRFGPMPEQEPATHTLDEMLGVNGIWGWATGKYTNDHSANEGINKYKEFCTHGRNYHDLDWDISDPDITPNFDGMPGSLAQTWLDWDREYGAWKDAGMPTQATIQFRSEVYPANVWNTPYQSAYNYGYAFARHFGPTHGTGNVTAMEVGNEPWHYEADFYTDVLAGMSEGAKAADPEMEVYSCALQAYDPSAEDPGALFHNYMGARMLESHAPYLDGLNVHHYTFWNDETGLRTFTFPENRASELLSILNEIRWRDHNMPGSKIYVSEWGWDSDGAGQSCTHAECVNERAQALYAVRGALLFNRLRVDRATWYFYANSDEGSSLFTRSGLTGTSSVGFAPKKSFVAFQALHRNIGGKRFLSALKEDDDGWVYLLGDENGTPTHLAAWLPVDESDARSNSVKVNVRYSPVSAVKIEGLNADGTQVGLPAYDQGNGDMTIDISTVPVIIELGDALTGTNDVANFEPTLNVFPNPVKDELHLALDSKFNGNAQIKIYDIHGIELYNTAKVVHMGKKNITIPVSDYSPGMYTCEIVSNRNNNSFRSVSKFIISE